MKKTLQLYFRTLYVKQNTLKLIKTKIRFAHVIGDIVRCLKGGNNMEKQRLATSVVEAKNPSSLRVKFDCGLNDNGKTIVKSRTYSNLKHDAAALDVYNVADALASLQQHDVLEIAKIDNTTLA